MFLICNDCHLSLIHIIKRNRKKLPNINQKVRTVVRSNFSIHCIQGNYIMKYKKIGEGNNANEYKFTGKQYIKLNGKSLKKHI